MVRIGERHPDEPVGVVGQRIEVRDRAIGHPVGVVPLARDGVDARLGSAGVATGLGREQRGEARARLEAVVLDQPLPVVLDPTLADVGRVHRELDVVEAPQRTVAVLTRQPALGPVPVEIETGIEVGLAEQRGAIAGGVLQVRGDAGRVDRQRDTVREHAVCAHVLAGEHRRPGRHAHGVLVVRTPVDDACVGERVDDGCSRDRAAVASERVVALLIGGDEEDLPAHDRISSRERGTARSSRRGSCARGRPRGARVLPRTWAW